MIGDFCDRYWSFVEAFGGIDRLLHTSLPLTLLWIILTSFVALFSLVSLVLLPVMLFLLLLSRIYRARYGHPFIFTTRHASHLALLFAALSLFQFLDTVVEGFRNGSIASWGTRGLSRHHVLLVHSKVDFYLAILGDACGYAAAWGVVARAIYAIPSLYIRPASPHVQSMSRAIVLGLLTLLSACPIIFWLTNFRSG